MRHRLKWFLSKLHFLSSSTYLRLAYWLETGNRLSLTDPRTFNEKLNWLKLNAWKPELDRYVNKATARSAIGRLIGQNHMVPLEHVFCAPSAIPWNKLPERFVLKCTHGSHCSIVVTDKAKAEREVITRQLERWLGKSWYWYGREPGYIDAHKSACIMIERYIGDGKHPPDDYKVMCFNGEPRIIQLHRRRGKETRIDFFDTDGGRLYMSKRGYPTSNLLDLPRETIAPLLPIARKIAQSIDMPYLRVDLYVVDGHVYFGEVTFFDSAGLRDFAPDGVNRMLGDMISLEGVRLDGG